ncbi:MAG TPA: pyridoxal phosphate-dependent aminotransferase family protein, partial [Cytophagaceae bacterium]|nr:pyridoxal phosphate-dependent aminotransferase family protein [Cytophagaceae bacterium]
RAEKVLLMNSGYNANIAILSSVPKKGDTIIYDELIHASLKDGSRLSFASRFPFKHNDLEDLEGKLKKGTGNLFVVLESVYSMDGDTAPLSELVDLCEKYGAHIILDEAHSTGIFGINGNGIACDLNIEYRIFARIYTFGKGMGIHGACLAGSKILMDYLVNFSRPFIYTTALPLHSVASVKCSFDYVRKNPELARSLSEKIGNFKNNLSSKIVDSKFYIDSFSPIQVFRMPGNAEAKKIATLLQRKNMDIRAILSPTVKEGEERIRICLHTFNTQEELTLLVQSVNELI